MHCWSHRGWDGHAKSQGQVPDAPGRNHGPRGRALTPCASSVDQGHNVRSFYVACIALLGDPQFARQGNEGLRGLRARSKRRSLGSSWAGLTPKPCSRLHSAPVGSEGRGASALPQTTRESSPVLSTEPRNPGVGSMGGGGRKHLLRAGILCAACSPPLPPAKPPVTTSSVQGHCPRRPSRVCTHNPGRTGRRPGPGGGILSPLGRTAVLEAAGGDPRALSRRLLADVAPGCSLPFHAPFPHSSPSRGGPGAAATLLGRSGLPAAAGRPELAGPSENSPSSGGHAAGRAPPGERPAGGVARRDGRHTGRRSGPLLRG